MESLIALDLARLIKILTDYSWVLIIIIVCVHTCRGHKRKLADDDVASESSKGSSNEDEEGSSSEADEMAAALEAELNDFM